MAHFKFAVSGQILDLLTPTRGISDGLNVNSAEFDFHSPDWDNTEKWAHFLNPDYNNGEPVDYMLQDDAITPDRGLNLPSGLWEVYLHGSYVVNGEVIRRLVTESQTIQILQSNIHDGEPFSSITESVGEQILAKAAAAFNERITAATIEVVPGVGTPYATVSITGDDGYHILNFEFENLVGVGIQSIAFAQDGLITVTLTDSTVVTYDGIQTALSTLTQTVATEVDNWARNHKAQLMQYRFTDSGNDGNVVMSVV